MARRVLFRRSPLICRCGFGRAICQHALRYGPRQSGMMNLDTFQHGEFMAAARQTGSGRNVSKVSLSGGSYAEVRVAPQARGVFHNRRRARSAAAFLRHYDDLTRLGVMSRFPAQRHPLPSPCGIQSAILMDDHGYDFDDALKIRAKTLHYTSRITLLREALENGRDLFEHILPAHTLRSII